MIALLGKKLGMTKLFDEKGVSTCVSVIEVGPCVVLGSTDKKVKLGYEEITEKKIKKPILGFFKKINLAPKKYIREVLFENSANYKVGDLLKADLFKVNDIVDVIGTTKGKGFQGGMKRWNWKGGPRAHGSTSHRRVGSIGSTTTPGRVIKGHHMPGHMGNAQSTVKNLKVITVNTEHNIIAVKGAVPGHRQALVLVKRLDNA